MMRSPFLLLLLVTLCVGSSTALTQTTDSASSIITNFKYVQINIIDTSNNANNRGLLPALNGTVIDLAENNMCKTPIFATACNRTNNTDLLLPTNVKGYNNTNNISVLSIFRCLSIWGPSRCTYDDGYTSVTYNQPQSASRPDTYTVHILTQYMGCPCSKILPVTNTTVTSLMITDVRLSSTYDVINVSFSSPVGISQSQPYGTIIPLNTLLVPSAIPRLGANATASWITSTLLQFRLGTTNRSLSETLDFLPGALFLANSPDIVVTTSNPRIYTSNGQALRLGITPRTEINPDVYCENIIFNIVGLWSGISSDIGLTVRDSTGNIVQTNYTLVSGNNTDVYILTLPSKTWPIGTYNISIAVPSPVMATATYQRTIDIWRTGSCECGQPRPNYYECRDCANPLYPCLNANNNTVCLPNPSVNLTSFSPKNATQRSTCQQCPNGYYGAACQNNPPCGINIPSSASVCGPNSLTCTNNNDAAVCTCKQDFRGTYCQDMSLSLVWVTIKLGYDYNRISNITQFSTNFTRELSNLLKRESYLFVVQNVTSGSTIVNFAIQPDRNNSVPARVIYNDFYTFFNTSTNNSLSSQVYPYLSTLDRTFIPIVLYNCGSIDDCTQAAVPVGERPKDNDDWKLAVGLAVGLGGGCLLLTCLFCLFRHHHNTTTTKEKQVEYPSSIPMTTTTTTTTTAAPVVVKQTPDGHTTQQAHDEHKEAVPATAAPGDEKRTVVFHV